MHRGTAEMEGRQIFNVQVYHCGGKDYGTVCGDINAFADEVKDLAHDLE